MKHIFLIGFMGSGKTAVAKELSHILQEKHIDLDTLVETMQKKDIPTIFKDEGEGAFREYEHQALHLIENAPIISTGGGIVERDENIHYMQENGIMIYLKTSFDVIASRLKDDSTRPLWKSDHDNKQLYQKRQPLYEAVADYIIDCDELSIYSITNQIVSIGRYKGIFRGE